MGKRFTMADLQGKIEILKKLAEEDSEAAHILQDELYRMVLETIAYGPSTLSRMGMQDLAAAALKIGDIDFDRRRG